MHFALHFNHAYLRILLFINFLFVALVGKLGDLWRFNTRNEQWELIHLNAEVDSKPTQSIPPLTPPPSSPLIISSSSL